MDFKKVIEKPEYDFLRTNKHLANNIMLLTLGGSYSYGTNIDTSDVDLRGCAYNRPEELIGLSKFEEVVNTETDTTIYSFLKLIKLLTDCNPNVIEMLGCLPEHYVILTEHGQLLIENRKMFLSKRAAYTFGGYATAQLRRLENALARDEYPAKEKERHILKTLEAMLAGIGHRYEGVSVYTSKDFLEETGTDDKEKAIDTSKNGIYLYLDKSDMENLEKEIYLSVKFEGYPLRRFYGLISEMNNIIKDFEKLNHRNRKKDDAHLNKHAMHLVRLLLTAIDVFEKGDIITYRKDDHNLLMSIRNGKFQKEDRTYRQEFFELVNDLQKRMEYAIKNSDLPERPDYKKIEELVMEINRHVLAGS